MASRCCFAALSSFAVCSTGLQVEGAELPMRNVMTAESERAELGMSTVGMVVDAMGDTSVAGRGSADYARLGSTDNYDDYGLGYYGLGSTEYYDYDGLSSTEDYDYYGLGSTDGYDDYDSIELGANKTATGKPPAAKSKDKGKTEAKGQPAAAKGNGEHGTANPVNNTLTLKVNGKTEKYTGCALSPNSPASLLQSESDVKKNYDGYEYGYGYYDYSLGADETKPTDKKVTAGKGAGGPDHDVHVECKKRGEMAEADMSTLKGKPASPSEHKSTSPSPSPPSKHEDKSL